jgi:metal-dependent HD superfamily phosphatase/phosphodiesterase
MMWFEGRKIRKMEGAVIKVIDAMDLETGREF